MRVGEVATEIERVLEVFNSSSRGGREDGFGERFGAAVVRARRGCL